MTLSLTENIMFCIIIEASSPSPGLSVSYLILPFGTVIEVNSMDG